MSKIMKSVVLLLCFALVLSACATRTKFVLPEGTRIYLPAKEVTYSPGKAKAHPFSWGSAGGIQYRLMKDGNVIQEGQLPSRFRIWSLIWPPFAIIYWPMGFKHCYDLTGKEPALCYN